MAGALYALAFAGVAGCYRPETPPVMAPVYRFADERWRSKAETNAGRAPAKHATDGMHTADYPVASLSDETRYTLEERTRAPVFFSLATQIDDSGLLRLNFPVPANFSPGDRVALETELSLHSAEQRLPSSVTPVELYEGTAVIRMEQPLPAQYAKQTIGIHISGTVVSKETAFYHRTAPVTVPPKAYLDFAIGIEEAAWTQGPVEFRARSCLQAECETLFKEVLDPSIADERRWQPRRIELASLAGREAAFSFESRLLSDKSDAFSLPIWSNPTVYAPAQTEKARPNIILISLDTLAAGHLSTYGYPFATAPFLDGVLAREGTVFERTVAAATTTPQSHMSMFTSVQPCQHGVTTGMEMVRGELVTLAEVLRDAQYATGAVTEDGWLGYQHGFGRGFNFYAENKSANLMSPEGQVDVTLAKARHWVMRNRDKPFFLFVHTFQVHDPYSPPEQYKGLFLERDGKVVDAGSPHELRELVAYDQEIRYTDDHLKHFFEFLRDQGALDNTVIVVTSDHGEEFFEHGYWGHGVTLYEEVTRVPLILWGPRYVARGRRDARLAGHIDLMPTILALAGVDAPAQTAGRNILDPAPESASDSRFTESRVAVAIGPGYEKLEVVPPSFMVQQGSRKMSRYRQSEGFRYEAFDLDTDPREKKNLLPAAAADFEPMKRLLDGYEETCEQRLKLKSQDEPSRTIGMDPEREEKLKALGYLQ